MTNTFIRSIPRCVRLLPTLAFLALVLGCAAKSPVGKTDEIDEWREKARTAKGYSPGPREEIVSRRPEVTRPQTAPAERPHEREKAVGSRPDAKVLEKPLPTQPLTLKMTEDWELAKLLRFMARVAEVSILINENVKGSAKLNVHKAPWDQVFVGILNANGLTYQWEGDIIRIVTLQDREQARKLVEAKKKMLVEEAEYDVKLKTLRAEEMRLEPYDTRIVYINYSGAEEIAKNLEKLLHVHKETTPEGAGPQSAPQDAFKRLPSVAVNTHNNALILHAIEADIVKMVNLIEQLDRPTPQILIEARIIETTKETARELGIKWGGLYHGTNDGKNYYIGPGFSSQSGGSGVGLDTAVSPESGTAANFPAGFLSTTTGTGTGAGAAIADPAGFTIGFLSQKIGKYILDVELSALQKEQKLDIVSTPSITTMDNQPATIESGRKIPYQTVDQYGNINIEWENAVLKLEVTPHVIAGEVLRMKVSTTKDEADFSAPVQGTPTIITRKAETNVVLLNGQTTVIGGLSKDMTEDADSGIPGLMNIPMLSWLFKSDSKKKNLDQLLIFITPYILKSRDEEIRKISMENR